MEMYCSLPHEEAGKVEEFTNSALYNNIVYESNLLVGKGCFHKWTG